MENISQNNQNRRPRGSRSGGRSRNRQGSQSSSSGSDSSSGRTRNRNRSGSSRSSQQPKQTTGQKILSVLTFGLLGKPRFKPAAKPASRKPEPSKSAPRSSSPRGGREENRPKRANTEVTSGRLYVGNLDYSTGEPELEELFKGVGNVLSAEVVTNPRTQQSKGFAFVEMGSIDEAKRAVSVLDDQDFMGRKLIVSGARSEGPHDGEESPLAESSSEIPA